MPQNLKKNLTNNLKPKQLLLSNKKSVYQDIFIDRSNLQKNYHRLEFKTFLTCRIFSHVLSNAFNLREQN